MNYLAHAYFSFQNENVLIGNMISDFVKGKKKFDYPLVIQKGIELHRSIDSFTDNHTATKEAKQYFKPFVGLYAGAFVDVVYDHFLAIDTNQFTTEKSLNTFAQNTYATLESNKIFLPEIFKNMLLKMKTQNWLYNYQFLWGMEKSFEGVVYRANYLDSSTEAFSAFKNNYTALQHCYNAFINDVKSFAFKELSILITQEN